jgi:hypothetical protein
MLFHKTIYHFYLIKQNLIFISIMVRKSLYPDSLVMLSKLLELIFQALSVLYCRYATLFFDYLLYELNLFPLFSFDLMQLPLNTSGHLFIVNLASL